MGAPPQPRKRTSKDKRKPKVALTGRQIHLNERQALLVPNTATLFQVIKIFNFTRRTGFNS